MADTTLRSRLLDGRPGARELKSQFGVKRNLALSLRALRKEKGLTQEIVATRSGLGQPMISRLESPTGPMPRWDTIASYVQACGGQIGLCLEPDRFARPANGVEAFSLSGPMKCAALS